jgi:hypothetical protein
MLPVVPAVPLPGQHCEPGHLRPSLRSAYQGASLAPGPGRVSTFRTSELRPGWVPPRPRRRRCSPGQMPCPAVACRFPAASPCSNHHPAAVSPDPLPRLLPRPARQLAAGTANKGVVRRCRRRARSAPRTRTVIGSRAVYGSPAPQAGPADPAGKVAASGQGVALTLNQIVVSADVVPGSPGCLPVWYRPPHMPRTEIADRFSLARVDASMILNSSAAALMHRVGG